MNNLIACHGCDLLVDVGEIENDSRAECPRCGHFLTRYQQDAMSRVLAYSLSAIVMLLLANLFSFLSFSSSGLESVMTLGSTPGALLEFDMPLLAAMVAAFIIYIPAVILALLVSISVPLLLGRYAFWLKLAARGVFSLKSWAMVEVFIIGVIVSLVKIAAMAKVELGISFWAYVAFSIFYLLAVTSLDRFQCWNMIETAEFKK